MGHIRVGLIADPAAPTQIAQGMTDLQPPDGRDTWDITVVSEPFTTGSEDVDTAKNRLQDHARQRDWDVVIGLTELPLHDQEGRHLLVESDPAQRTSVLSLPALGGLRMHSRARHAVRSLSTPWQTQTPMHRRRTTSPSLGGEVAGACSWAWCLQTVLGGWCPG